MKTLKQLAEERAKELGVMFEVSGGRYFELLVQAPQGKVFTGSDLHEAVLGQYPPHTREDVWKEALREMDMGIKICPDIDCEWCESNKA